MNTILAVVWMHWAADVILQKALEGQTIGKNTVGEFQAAILRAIHNEFPAVDESAIQLIQDPENRGVLLPGNLYTALAWQGIIVDSKNVGSNYMDEYGGVWSMDAPGKVNYRPVYPLEHITVSFIIEDKHLLLDMGI